MHPDDRVLVSVINRKRDLIAARDEHWYRIPRNRAPSFIDAEYIAFFLSQAFKAQNGGVHYYALRTGHELVRRRDLLPNEANHRRAEQLYYKIALGELKIKEPPILNPTHRSISFIYTTWDRFVVARTVADLYSKADTFVERVARALNRIGISPERCWESENPAQRIAELRIWCEKGILRATVGEGGEGALRLSFGESDEAVDTAAETIQAAVAAFGGPVFVDIPLDG